MEQPHPMQVALDRASRSAFAIVDLLYIAGERTQGSRSDARQSSLYGAAVTASMAALEESFEAMLLGGLECLGLKGHARTALHGVISRQLQSPHPTKLISIFNSYLKFNPEDFWRAPLIYSPPVYHKESRKGNDSLYEIYTYYHDPKEFAGKKLTQILSRFSKLRNSFAHQDPTSSIFDSNDELRLFKLRTGKAVTENDVGYVESLSTVCAVTLDSSAVDESKAIARWALHESHAINSLLAFAGIVSTTCSSLLTHLADFDGFIEPIAPLVFRIDKGEWLYREKDELNALPSKWVDFEFCSYRPLSRSTT